ncbi:RNA 2',3'-cyclic phosphodiesterase [Nitrospira sp. Kam-Ns4a]
MIRTFVAVELDEPLRAVIGRVQAEMRERLEREFRREAPDVRLQWVRPESIHVTLKFLGEIEEGRVAAIGEALERIAASLAPFAVEVGGLGVFPDARAPRVVWLGLSGQVDALVRLAAEVDAALHALGFPREDRPFAPHLTLARVKDRQRDVGRALAASGLLDRAAAAGSLRVRAIALMKSDLRPSGAVYTRLHEAVLAGG